MKLPLCYRAGAARVITASQKRAERARRWRPVLAGLAFLVNAAVTGTAVAMIFFGAVALMKG